MLFTKRIAANLSNLKSCGAFLQETFEYADKKDRLMATTIFFDLWRTLLSQIECCPYEQKEDVFKMIINIIQRKEFTVSYLMEDETNNLGENFHALMLDTLRFTLRKISERGTFPAQLTFNAQVLMLAFFKIPILCGPVIQSVLDSLEMQRPEKLTSEELEEKNIKFAKGHVDIEDSLHGMFEESRAEHRKHEVEFMDSNPSLFQWNNFMVCDDDRDLLIGSGREGWCKWLNRRLVTRPTMFPLMLMTLIRHVMNTTTDSKKVVWEIIPGYVEFVRIFVRKLLSLLAYKLTVDCRSLTLMEDIRLTDQPFIEFGGTRVGRCPQPNFEWNDSLEKLYLLSSNVLLVNGNLLNLFVRAAFQATHLFSPKSVQSTLHLIFDWFKSAARKEEEKWDSISETSEFRDPEIGTSLPSSFDMEYFLECIEILLSSELFQVVLKTLQFLYAAIPFFQGERRRDIITNLFFGSSGHKFFRFFLHWNYEVRRFFLTFVVFKLFRSSRLVLPLHDDLILQEHTNDESSEAPRLSISSVDLDETFPRPAVATTAANLLKKAARKLSGATTNRHQIFDSQMDDETQTIDLVFAAKLNHCLQLIRNEESGDSRSIKGIAYGGQALRQYASLLRDYHKAAGGSSSTVVPSPPLFFDAIDVPL
eukprot:TRINITY_DN2130_c0_g1_i2.p1 TRINITY_DN2130_c0_g1~~TRINITY_DN2130_c0_g1_i2.p1  ORF type:complete len:647 (-),score=150.04 TRINITY_DN2130_c0_g1_i2:2449-4389(-)